jgi:hypothetical protein
MERNSLAKAAPQNVAARTKTVRTKRVTFFITVHPPLNIGKSQKNDHSSRNQKTYSSDEKAKFTGKLFALTPFTKAPLEYIISRWYHQE